MYWVYVLKSDTNKIYIGQTENIEKRLKQHNDRLFDRRSYTKLSGHEWNVVYKEEYNDRKSAMKRETYLKSHVGRDWIKTKLNVIV